MLPALGLILLMLSTVALIVSGHRTPAEHRLRQRYGFDRDWWVPVIALAIAGMNSWVGWSTFRTTLIRKIDIIALIFAFGVLARGLGASGLFRFLSYRVVERCQGETVRLVVAVFGLTSLLTLVTSNDIVILVMTPIMVEICFQAGIRNARPVLLTQFIAANTLSMGLLIGSPTNIILGESLGIGFIGYLGLMLLPTLVAVSASYLVLRGMLALAQDSDNGLLDWLRVHPSYSVPAESPEPAFTDQMRDWLVIFGVFIGLVTVVTYLQASLLYCAVPAIVLALAYWHRFPAHDRPVTGPVYQLPFGILFFGMTFFTLAAAFFRTGLVIQQLVPALQSLLDSHPLLSPFLGIFGSGVLVNTVNDLPAAALTAQLLPLVEPGTAVGGTVLIQSVLVGLNIGTYVTPIGALAGLIWFDRMRVQHRRERQDHPYLASTIQLPGRWDLVRFGLVQFLLTGAAVGLFLVAETVVLSAIA